MSGAASRLSQDATPSSAQPPEVTAIVTCMTDAERPWVGAAVESILGQSHPTRIVLCVAEGNTWIGEVVNLVDVRIILLELPLMPLGLVRNRALLSVKTEFVAFLDGDDLWHSRKVERQIKLMRENRLDVVASRHVLVRPDGTAFFFGFARSVPMPSSWLGRTQVFRDRPFTDVALGEDVALWRQLQAEVAWQTDRHFLLRYRVRGGSLSGMTWSKRRKLAFERRSRWPGVRPLLLGASYAANVVLDGSDWTKASVRRVRRSA